MTSTPQSLPPSVDSPTAASPGEGATTPHRCPSCSHVTIPGCRCECGHLDVFHAFNTKNTIRKACSHHEGARNTRCSCAAFTPELPEETSP